MESMRYEFHFNEFALIPQMGITQQIQYAHKIPSQYWSWRAKLIVDHLEKKIIKDREGRFDSYNNFIERN